MLSLRLLSRQAPRGVARISSLAARQIQKPAQLQALSWGPAFAPSSLRLAAQFSSSRAVRDENDSANQELAAKLESELAYEQQEQEDNENPNLKEYLEHSSFQLQDTPGNEEVSLTRTYGDEKIKVTFSIADFNTMEDEANEDDPALFDEENPDTPSSAQSGGANTKGAVPQGRTSGGNIRVSHEDGVSPADRPEMDNESEDMEPGFPAQVAVTVTREGKGALTIECLAEDGQISIQNVYYFPTAELAEAKTAEKDWTRRSLYTGPPFGQLDDDLQLLLERYLEERGINTSMALFIPEYIDQKEQQEYIRWLGNMKSFVE
ncbi:hypothetical protein BT93_L0382 [Corymbia citriodora subsp. variegata]|uniref:Mitochondrial glyco protein n=1 Tax=Corymbia citriodora subsp. variegata TaxID=360336 RepID=A0A8T0CFM8_CORYI|nr:hypothetical protein BT93_L0382 [Corymbia citriodora subsp. variegata]